MKRTIAVLAVMVANAALGTSLGWPPKDVLPEWLSVDLAIPQRWGSELAFDLHSVVSIKFTNVRDSDVRMLNFQCVDPKFYLIKKDGSTVPVAIEISQLRVPELNPGMTLGARSAVSLEIEFDRPSGPGIPPDGDLVFEVKVQFVAGDIVARREAGGRVSPNVRWLEGFEYTLVRRLPHAERLMK